jgi:hypoxanthine-guanine phosphoribosyltransferase
LKVLLDEDELERGVRLMAGQIAACYGQGSLTNIGILAGSIAVGYGLDVRGRAQSYRDADRNLPFVAALEPDDLSEDPA